MVTYPAESFISEVTGSADPCEISVEDDKHLGNHNTIRSLLNALTVKLQKEKEMNPAWLSTTQLEGDHKTLEAKYSSIPGTVNAYKDEYENFKNQLKKAREYESKLNSQTNDEQYQSIRKAISHLWEKNYSEAEIYRQYKQAWQDSKNIKTCLDKALLDVSTVVVVAAAARDSSSRGIIISRQQQQQQLQQLEQQGQERKQQDIYDQTFDPSSPNLKQW